MNPIFKAWLDKHSRFHSFPPTSASWLSMVERFFRSITVDRLRRGVFRNVADLKKAISQHIAAYNSKLKPFVWTAKANDILQESCGASMAKVVQTA